MHTDQNQISPLRVGVSLLLFSVLLWLSFIAQPETAGQDKVGYWYSITPPLMAIMLVLATRRLIASMILSIMVGGILVAMQSGSGIVTTGLTNGLGYGWAAISDSWNLQVLAFVPFVMAMIAVMVVAGGFQALVNRLARYSFGRKGTQIKTFLAGIVLFFDDYANTMVVGSGMRPLTDRQKISRAKLAFLVDATSAPIAGLAIMSTWIGYEVGLFKEVATTLSIGKDGFSMFIDALGFRFYCIMMILFVVINILSGRDYGPMLSAEKKALREGPIHDTTTGAQQSASPSPSLWNLFLPLGVMMGVMLTMLWLDGGGAAVFAADSLGWLSLGKWMDVLAAVENSITVLMWSAIAGFATAIFGALTFGRINIPSIGMATLSGIKLSLIPLTILVLAWSLKNSCDALGTGKFLVAAVGDNFSPILFPAVLFAIAGLTAFSTGTSWGTMAILIPTAIPVAFALDGSSYGLITMICLGAVLDGAIMGDHCSPISDTTIMSSTASSCNHMEHVRTQLPYSLTVALFAVVLGYLPAAAGMSPLLSYALAAIAIIGTYVLFSQNRDHNTEHSLFGRHFGFLGSSRKASQSESTTGQSNARLSRTRT